MWCRAFHTEKEILNPVITKEVTRIADGPRTDRDRKVIRVTEGNVAQWRSWDMPPEVYLPSGERIPLAVPDKSAERECGVLLNLDVAAHLVTEPRADNDSDDGTAGALKRGRDFQLYPLGFTGSLGNLQTRSRFLSTLQDFPGDIQDMVETRHNHGPLEEQIIQEGGSQTYGEICHRIRAPDGLMDVARGLVTGALAGVHFRDSRSSSKATTLRETVSTKLPHQHFNDKVCAATKNLGS